MKAASKKNLVNPGLSFQKLTHTFDHKIFKFKSTEKVPELKEIIGQDRAAHALMFGLEIKNNHYNIYALGPTGTGKTTTIRKYLEKEAKNKATPSDWLYLNNFDDQDKPNYLELPAGKGYEFRDDMDQLVAGLKTEVPKAFEAENYHHELEVIEKNFRAQSEGLLQQLTHKAEERGFRLVQTPHGFAVLPEVDGKLLTQEEQAALDETKRKEIEVHEDELITEIHEAMHKFENLQKDGVKNMQDLDQHVVGLSINHLINALKDKYHKFKNVTQHLASVRAHLLKNVRNFKNIKQSEEASPQERMMMFGKTESMFEEYRVNLIVDNSKTKGAPVIFEKNPIAPNLVGRIEQQGVFGALVTNFRMIKGGALHRANGGYLILDFLDLLKKPFSWEVLKRTLKNKEIVIESMMENLGMFTTRTLEPEAIPLNIKVILTGDSMYYYLIHAYDPEFQELFKVKADFATDMPWTNQAAYQYAQFISMVCHEEKLKHFSPDGVAKIVEYGARLIEHHNKISTKFGDIADLVRQSAFWAGKNNNKLVTASDVEKALDEKVYRSNRIEEIIREMIADKSIKISTTDSVVGQINGLAVLSLGDYSFGKPSRLTAKTFVGGAGFVSIEREIELGGPIHNKGSMIISGYLGGKYAQDVPMALSASLTFEQTYEQIEGDSASAAEIFVLLSSLSGLPLRQDLAVTGSVNQHGEIQAIGGVNEKIEGFFRVCKMQGLTGKQGVIIPESNVQNLMLHSEVVAAVKAKKFYIYPIASIDEGIEILTGTTAGTKNKDGSYPKNTVNWLVQQRIIDLAHKAHDFKGDGDKRKGKGKNKKVKKK
jgi:lon-related putative ATP-dependent protease